MNGKNSEQGHLDYTTLDDNTSTTCPARKSRCTPGDFGFLKVKPTRIVGAVIKQTENSRSTRTVGLGRTAPRALDPVEGSVLHRNQRRLRVQGVSPKVPTRHVVETDAPAGYLSHHQGRDHHPTDKDEDGNVGHWTIKVQSL